MAESVGATSPSSKKDSTGKKAGKQFRISTLFPQATFVNQLGLDKLTPRNTPPPPLDATSPQPQSSEGIQLEKTTKKTLAAKGQDNASEQQKTASATQDTTTKSDTIKHVSPPAATPTGSENTKSNIINQNGKRFRGFSADTPSIDLPERPAVSMRSNTVVPATRTIEPIIKPVETAPVPPKVPPVTNEGGSLTRVNSGPLLNYSTPRRDSIADITNPFDDDDTEQNINTENSRILSGTFGKIVEKITDDKFGDAQMLVVFLNTYRTFVSPIKLLNILILRYTTSVRFVEGQDQEAKQKAVRLRIMVVFKHWIESHWQDWQDNDTLVEEFKKFILKTVIPSGLQKSADILTHLLHKKRLEVEREALKSEVMHTGKTFDLWGFSIMDIATQITLIEFNFYKSIKLHEFLKLAWTKKNAKKRAPNILAFIEFFNKMAEWVKAEIITQDQLPRRIDKLGKFLELAEKFLHLNNFNGVAEIVAALDSAPVYRLKKTWEGLPESKKLIMQQLREIVAPSKSYAKLREKLHTANPPCIPYLGVYLTDLTFIHDGNPDLIPDSKMVNFQKCMLISDVLREIQLYQQTKFMQVINPQFKKFIMNFAGFSEEESYDLSLEIEPRVRANSTPEKVEGNDTIKATDTIKQSKGSRLKLSVITTLESVRSHGPPTPPSPATTKPPQEMLTLTNKLVKKKWGKKAWLDLSEEPFYVYFQLLGTTSPLMVRLPPKCTTAQALAIFEDTFRGVAVTCKMVVMPTALYPTGRVLAEDEGLDGYCIDKGMRNGPVLMIFGKPVSVRVGVSRSNSVERLEDIILDLSAPIFALIPILQNVFAIKEEFAFLYIEGAAVARWMNMGRTLENQALDPDKGLLLIFPLVNLLQRSLSSLGPGEKSGYLNMKKTEQVGSYLRGTHKRYFTLHDHFLMWFDNDNQDATPRGLISLDHFSARLGQDKVLTLFRSFKGFSSTISKYNYYKFTGASEEETAEWFSLVQQCRGSVGDQVIFGIPLAAAVNKRGANNLPIVVLKTITYLTENDFLDEKLFKEQITAQLLEFYIDQFDQGVNVDFTHMRHPASVAQLLVIYLTMLPDPLLTFDLFDQFVQQGSQFAETTISRRPTSETERKNIVAKKKSAEDRLASLVSQLPVVNRSVLCFLLEFLNEIIAKAREGCADDSVAFASTRSLAGVFGPACLRPNAERGQVTPARGECEFVMQQLILQNEQLFATGSEVKIIRRAKVKNMLQASTQSIHLTAQLAESAQQLTRESSSIISGLELKTSKDPHENELLQAVYGTLKKKQAMRQGTQGNTPPGIMSLSFSPPSSLPSSTEVSPPGPFRGLPRPPSPPLDDSPPISFIPSSLPPPTPPPTLNHPPRPSSPPLLSSSSSSSSSPTSSVTLSPSTSIGSIALEDSSFRSTTPSLSIVEESPTGLKKGESKDKIRKNSLEKSAPKQDTPPRPKSQEKQPVNDKPALETKLRKTTLEKSPNSNNDKSTEKGHHHTVGFVIDRPLGKISNEKITTFGTPQLKPTTTFEKPTTTLEKPTTTFEKPTCEKLEELAALEKSQDREKLEKMLDKPWPKPPPMPEYRLSRRISALKKFNRDRSSKKNSKPPIDIFEGEKEASGKTESLRVKMANLRNMFEKADDTPKLPVSNSKLFGKQN